MKSNILMAMAIAVVSSLSVCAQPQIAQPYSGKSPKEVRQVIHTEGLVFPAGLDEKQREEIKKIRMDRMKERTQTRNQLKEKNAKLEVLQTADKPDMKEINKVIDEIATIKANEMKADAASRQKIRSMLTEEQRIYFDAQRGERGQMRESRNERPARVEVIREQRVIGDRPQRHIEKDTVVKGTE